MVVAILLDVMAAVLRKVMAAVPRKVIGWRRMGRSYVNFKPHSLARDNVSIALSYRLQLQSSFSAA